MSELEPQVVRFGPYRAIGMGASGKPESIDFGGLWQEFHPRIGEVVKAAEDIGFFGICRCIPGATDGSFEYVAAFPAAPDAPIPDGMTEAKIGEGHYAVFEVAGLGGVGKAFQDAGAWLAAHPEWESCCGEGKCDCANYPWFELYPPDFTPEGKLFIYAPVRAKVT